MTKTVGEQALEAQKNDVQSDYIELQKEIHQGSNSKKSYEEEVWEAVDRGRKDDHMPDDFFVVVLFKKERHLQNIVRQYFFYRQSCPTPEYDQTVYLYEKSKDALNFMWCIPNNATVLNLTTRSKELPFDQQWLADMCKAFTTGELDKWCEQLNQKILEKQQKSSVSLIK